MKMIYKMIARAR